MKMLTIRLDGFLLHSTCNSEFLYCADYRTFATVNCGDFRDARKSIPSLAWCLAGTIFRVNPSPHSRAQPNRMR